MSATLFLNSCVEVNNCSWVVRASGVQFGDCELYPEIAQHKAVIAAAKVWVYTQPTPAVCSLIIPSGDRILRFNEASLKLLNLSRHNENSELSCSEFWKNREDYWDFIRDLKQNGKAENTIELISFDGAFLGRVGVVGQLLPLSLMFVSRVI